MPLGTFCNKLNPTHSAYFTDTEIIKLKGILRELQNDLDGVTDIDFNDTLKGVIKGLENLNNNQTGGQQR